MPKISYLPEGFDASLGNRFLSNSTLTCSWPRLVWSAITVGRDSWNKVVQFGMYSAFEIIYRGSMLFANLEESPKKKLAQSDAYENLDPSEKSAISYFLGLTSAKLFAQKLLRVPWLLHYDIYKNFLNIQVSGKSKPDLVGRDKLSRWIVIEAKGRTHGIGSKEKLKAKNQVDQLTSINGATPFLGMGIISYFNSGKKLEVFLKDPPTEGSKGDVLAIEDGVFFFHYYKMFVDLINSNYGSNEHLNVDNRDYMVKYIEELDVWVGIDSEIYNLISESKPNATDLAAIPSILPEPIEPMAYVDRNTKHTRDPIDEDDKSLTLIGEDGIYVQLGRKWEA